MNITYLIISIILLALVILAIIMLSYLPLWIQVRVSGVPITIFKLIAIRLRGLEPKFICHHIITLRKAGINVGTESLEAHVLSGGSLNDVTEALISSNKAGLGYSFDRIAGIELAGRDVVDAVETTVKPKVLVCPADSSEKVMGVAKDGIRLSVKVRITVRTNFDRLIGGARESTIIARVGEGIVAAIGSAHSHKSILEKPELISQYILSAGLDRGSSFEILSTDVSELEVIDNVGARLQEVQAEADKKVAQAKAEMRRVAAVAREKEMKAKVVEMTSQVTFTRSTIPHMIALSYLRGKIWRSPNPVFSGQGRRLWDSCEN